MIQSIQAGETSLFQQNPATTVTAKVVTEEPQTTAPQQDENTETSSQGDVLTISNAGKQASKTFSAQSANRPSTGGTTEDSYTDATAAALAEAASGMGITEATQVKNEESAATAAISSGSSASSSSSSSSSESSLANYTDAQLKEMLANGEITRAEYDAEIKSRSESSDTTEDEDETTNVTGADATEA